MQKLSFEPNKKIHIKITRKTEYGDRYKLIVINKGSYNQDFDLNEYGMSLVKEKKEIAVDKLKWNGLAKKSGMITGDIISEFKIQNLDRPNKGFVYPFALILLLFFGYFNYRRKEN